MAEQKKPPGEDPLKRLLLDAGAEIDARLRDWMAKSSGKPGVSKPTSSSGKPGGLPQHLPSATAGLMIATASPGAGRSRRSYANGCCGACSASCRPTPSANISSTITSSV